MATRTISTKLAIEGESEYRNAIKNINSEYKTLKSEMDLVKSEYQNHQNSMEALTKKSEELAKQQENLTNKVNTCKEGLANAQSSVDKYSSEVDKLKDALEKNQKAQSEMSDEVKQAGTQYNDYQSRLSEAEAKMKELQSTTGDTSKEEEEQTKIIEECKNGMAGLEEKYGDSVKTSAELQTEEQNLNASLSENEANLEAAQKGTDQWQQDLNKAQTQLNNTNAEIENNDKYLEEAANSADGCATSIDEFGKKTSSADESLEKTNKSLDIMTAQMAQRELQKAFDALKDALMACVDAAAEFEQQMSTVQAISGATGEDMNALTDIAKEMGSTTTFTAEESGEALEYMALAGWKTEDMLDGLPAVLDLAAASGSDLATTSDIVTDALTAFGYEASDAAHFSDVLAASSSNSNTTVEQLGSAFQKVGPLAGTMGYSVEDVSEALGLMANSGIKAESAGTALNTMLTRMSGTNSSARNELEKLNVEMYNADGTARPLGDVIDDLRGAFSNLSDSEATEAAYNLAGQRGMSAMLAIVQSSDEDYDKLSESIDTCNGAAADMAETKLDNYAGQVTLLESAWDGLKVEIGEQVTPVLGDCVEWLTNIVNWITNFIQDNPAVVAAITGIATALGIMTAAVAALVAGMKIYQLVEKAIQAMNPFGWVTLAITAVAALAAGIAVFCSALSKNLNPGVEESKKRVKDLNEEMEDLEDTVEETSDAIEENADSTDFLKNAIVNLLEKEQLSEAEKQKMADYVDELNELYPDLGLSIDETTGSLDMETDAFENLIDAAEDSSELTALAQEQEEAEKAVADATNDLNTAYDERDLVIAALNGDEDAYNQLLDEGSIKVGFLQSKTSALEKYERQLNKEIDNGNDALDEAQGYYDECTEACDELEQELLGLSDAEMDSYSKVGSQTEMLCDALLELQNSYDEVKQSAQESAHEQFDMFEQVEKEAKSSAKDIEDALKSQQDYWKEYSNNLQNLQSRNIDGLNEMVAEFSDGSTEAAAYVASFADMTDEELQEIIDMWRGVTDEEENWADASAEMSTQYTQEMQDMIDQFTEWINSNEEITEEDKQFMIDQMDSYVQDLSEEDEDYEGELEHISDATKEYLTDSLGMATDSVASLSDEMKKQESSFKTYSGKMEDAGRSIDNLHNQLKDLKEQYNEVRDASIESAETQFGMFDKVEQAAVTSFDDIMAALESQAEYWNNYGDNINKILSSNIDGIDEWVASWDDGSEDAAAAAASFAELTPEQLQTVVDYMNNDLAGSWSNYGDASAEAQTNITAQTAEFTEEEKGYINDMMDALDMSEEGKNMAWGFINEYIDGLAEGEEPMSEEYENIISGVQYFCEERLGEIDNFSTEFLDGLYTKLYEADLTPEAEQLIWDAVDAADQALAEGGEVDRQALEDDINQIVETMENADLGPGAGQAIWEAINAAQEALEEGDTITLQQIDDIIADVSDKYEEFREQNQWFTQEWIDDISETMTGLDFSEDAQTDAWNLIMAYSNTLPEGIEPSQEAIDQIMQVISDSMDMDDDARENAISGITSFYEALQETGTDNIDKIEETMDLITETMDLDDESRSKALSSMSSYMAGLKEGKEPNLTAMREIIDVITGSMEDGADDAEQAGEDTTSGYAEGIEETADEAKSAGEKVGDAFVEGTDSRSDDYKESGKNAGKGYAEGISDEQKDVEQAAADTGEASIDALNESLDEHSPSKETEKSGENFVEGFTQGIKNEESDVEKEIESLAKAVLDAWDKKMTKTALSESGANALKGFEDGLENNKNNSYKKMEDIADQALKRFKNGVPDSALRSTGENTIQGFINGLNNKSGSLYNTMSNLANNALKQFNNTLGVHSPSKEAEWSGEKTAEGYALGVDENTGLVEKSMSELAKEALGSFVEEFEQGMNTMMATAQDAQDVILSFARYTNTSFSAVEASTTSLVSNLHVYDTVLTAATKDTRTAELTFTSFAAATKKDMDTVGLSTNSLSLILSQFDKQLLQTIKDVQNYANTTALYASGQNTIQGYINGLNDKSSSLNQSMINLAQNALNSFNDTLGVHSPSTEAYSSAAQTIIGWINGIAAYTPSLEESMSDLAQRALAAFNDGMTGNSNSNSALLSLTNSIEQAMNGSFAPGSTEMKSLQKSAQDALNAIYNELMEAGDKTGAQSIAAFENALNTAFANGFDSMSVSILQRYANLASDAFSSYDDLTTSMSTASANVSSSSSSDTYITVEIPIYENGQYTRTEIEQIAIDGINRKQSNSYAAKGVSI